MRQGVLLDPGILGEPAANRGNDRVRIAAVELDAAFELPKRQQIGGLLPGILR